MNENTYVRFMRVELELLGAKTVKFVPSGTGTGEPDVIGSYDGQTFVIEAKVYPNTPSELQLERRKEWAKAGAIAVIATYPMHTPKLVAKVVVGMAGDFANSRRYSQISPTFAQDIFEATIESYKNEVSA